MSDNVTAVSEWNKLLGLTKLPNGVTVVAQSNGATVFSGSFLQLADFLQIPESIYDTSVGAASTWLTVNFPFKQNPVILNGAQGDHITFTINDDMSGLLFFRTFVTVTEDL
jgi:hypothetical protein